MKRKSANFSVNKLQDLSERDFKLDNSSVRRKYYHLSEGMMLTSLLHLHIVFSKERIKKKNLSVDLKSNGRKKSAICTR